MYTYLSCNNRVKDFCIKMQYKDQIERGIREDSVGRYVVVYGIVTVNGIGLCFERLGWGYYGLLSEKYSPLLGTCLPDNTIIGDPK
jgi:hypothetical protein